MLVLSRMALLVVSVDPDSRASAVWSMMPDADVHNEVQCTIDMESMGFVRWQMAVLVMNVVPVAVLLGLGRQRPDHYWRGCVVSVQCTVPKIAYRCFCRRWERSCFGLEGGSVEVVGRGAWKKGRTDSK
jgi:hypothetical protein